MNEYKIWIFEELPEKDKFGSDSRYRLEGEIIANDLSAAIIESQLKHPNQRLSIETPNRKHRIEVGPEMLNLEQIKEINDIVG